MDYSEYLIGITAAIKEYRQFMLKNDHQNALIVSVEISSLALALEDWTLDKSGN